jgi:hypothetical protein
LQPRPVKPRRDFLAPNQSNRWGVRPPPYARQSESTSKSDHRFLRLAAVCSRRGKFP